jgi:hypothetical protein
MNKSKNLRASFRITIIAQILMLFLLSVSPVNSAEPMPLCATANANCAKQKAILRQLERTRPSRKQTRMQIFNRIKAACERMRNLDCPDIKNSRPLICFTDF